MVKTMNNNYEAVSSLLFSHYPQLRCALEFKKPYELLVAARLSAQCTDRRVNLVCKELFAVYPDFPSLAQANLEDVERIIRPCGLYHVKAKDIIAASQYLKDRPLPRTLEGFLELPGVGRKIANLLMGELYNEPGVIVADTHCIRLSNRLGFCETKDPVKVEAALRKIVRPEESMQFCHGLVFHGRQCCKAQNPDCAHCFLTEYCREFQERREK